MQADWIYTVWDHDNSTTLARGVGAIEAQQSLVEAGVSLTGAANLIERAGTPDDLALEVAGFIVMNVTDMEAYQ